MQIINLKTNRMVNPLGFNLGKPTLSWQVSETTAKSQAAARVEISEDAGFCNLVHDSGKSDLDSIAYSPEISLKPMTRYYWRVTVWADNGDMAESSAWFETGRMGTPFAGEWIAPDTSKLEDDTHPLLRKTFKINSKPSKARIYATGLGIYELYLNGKRVGDDYLTPHCNAYDHWIQIQTYDISDDIPEGDNELTVMLGNGWYKGKFSLDFSGTGNVNLYGDAFAFLCDICVECEDGSKVVIPSDTTFESAPGPVRSSSIYDGEVYDARKAVPTEWFKTSPIDIGFDKLEDRRSLPVKIMETLKVKEIICTPKNEIVIDMGQNFVGWLSVNMNAPEGTEILLQFSEAMVDGCFFNDNLRSAKAEYTYISAGKPETIRPYFTFFGGRFIKVTGWPGTENGSKINPDDFTGCVVYSDIEQTGSITTANPLVNRLFLNALWGQKGNFLDVPTDCPQRDERLGWTGDAQVFSGTANFNMDCAAFFSKYMYDMLCEQNANNGRVPMVVPAARMHGGGSSAWGDAATVIPWNSYLFYGDKVRLAEQFDNMKSWVDFIKNADDESGGHRLWTVGFHFGDWLALDGDDPKSPMGGTEEAYISSAYYCYSAALTAKAAEVLGKDDLAKYYANLSDEVRASIQKEYFTQTGRLAIRTQTAHVVALFMGLSPNPERTAEDLKTRLSKDAYHLKTGFVGTPYLCRVLSENGLNDIAYRLLLNEDLPSWLYEVKMGATTIWERWNSILPNGQFSDISMNSLNHYAYGSIVEWMYRNMLGINEAAPGFRKARLRPQPDCRLGSASGYFDSPAGRYALEWKIGEDGGLSFKVSVPFGTTAELTLPDAPQELSLPIQLETGEYEYSYMPTKSYIYSFGPTSTIAEIISNPEAKAVIAEYFPQVENMTADTLGARGNIEIGNYILRPIFGEPRADSEAVLKDITEKLGKIRRS